MLQLAHLKLRLLQKNWRCVPLLAISSHPPVEFISFWEQHETQLCLCSCSSLSASQLAAAVETNSHIFKIANYLFGTFYLNPTVSLLARESYVEPRELWWGWLIQHTFLVSGCPAASSSPALGFGWVHPQALACRMKWPFFSAVVCQHWVDSPFCGEAFWWCTYQHKSQMELANAVKTVLPAFVMCRSWIWHGWLLLFSGVWRLV